VGFFAEPFESLQQFHNKKLTGNDKVNMDASVDVSGCGSGMSIQL